jgi:pyroglutamyl-peptidase
MSLTVLITGFGPFPGAPFNPSGPLAQRLARRRRPALADVRRVAHVFATSYAAVDRDLPALFARIRPDVMLMFGLAARTRHVRVETQARNAIAQTLPDAYGRRRAAAVIDPTLPGRLRGAAPFARLVTTARGHGVAVRRSTDAGRYLCNYLYFRALVAAGGARKPPLVQFVHIPLTRRHPRPLKRVKRGKPALAALAKAGEAVLVALVSAAQRR